MLLQFLIVWKSPLPILIGSMALKKGSPYGLFMKNLMFRITEKGQLNRLTSRFAHRVKPQECKTGLAKGNPLGLKKISFPFFVAFFGFLLSGLTCLCERIFWTPKIIGKTSWQIQVNQSKNVLHSEIGHLKSVLRQANAFKWDWLDEMLVKIQDSQVQYDQL
jgi:hypothetical protein